MRLRIAELCREAGITQAELADKVGISKVGLSKAINGNPTLDTLERLANGLEVSIVELFEPKRSECPRLICPQCGAKLKIVLDEDEKDTVQNFV